MPPPVLIVGPSPPPYGGMALQAGALVARLQADGVDVEFLATNPCIPKLIARIKGVRTVLQFCIFLWKLCQALMRRRVVHLLAASHWYFMLRVVPTVLLSRCFGRRVILNYRGGEAPKFFASYRWLVLPVLRWVDKIVVPSAYLQRVFADHGFSASIIANFVDLRRFRFRQRDALTPNFLVNRSLEPLYNVRMAIDAFAIVKAKYPAACLEVVGAGSEEATLKDWVVNAGIPNVCFHGAVPNESMPLYLEKADVILNPSNADNMPISLLEAFAAGVPVVTTNVGGIPDMVGSEEAALLVDPGDSRAMARKVEELLNAPQKVRSLTTRAKALSDQSSWERVGRLWLEIYDPQRQSLAPEVTARAGSAGRSHH